MSFGKRFDAVTGVVLLVLSGYVYMEGLAMPQVTKGLGPGGYPVFVAFGLAVLSLILIVQALVRYAKDKSPILTLTRQSILRVLWFVFLTLAYLTAMPYLGFILSSMPLLVYLTYFYGYRRLWINVATNVIFTLAIYMLFRHFFLVLLPTGSLFV